MTDDGMDFYRDLMEIHRKYREDVDARIQSGFDYFGRPIDFSKSKVPGFCYHLYSGDSIVYVGKTRDPGGRMFGPSGHSKTKEWFCDVDRVEFFRFETEAEAYSAESYDIVKIMPRYNTRINPAPKKRPDHTHRISFDISQREEIYECVNIQNHKVDPDLL